ncbi:MAG: tRNA (N(6)-L-threonylcarbamoyladenosine(37)-C(2))-methylthiotransferase MtaB [Clostridia bacterium]
MENNLLKKVAFYTLGCKVNQYETDLMKCKFQNSGAQIVDFESSADIYVINSCSVTNLSTRKSRQYLNRAKKQGSIVVLVGCYAQEIKDNLDNINADIILGNEEKENIVDYVLEYIAKKEKIVKISEINEVNKFLQKSKLDIFHQVRESVKIEDGCNNFCSYCIIPYVRGRVRSRAIEDIEEEVENLVLKGVCEIVLVGIEIASYGLDIPNYSLIDVIDKVAKIDGVKRVRLGSIEPRILTDENIERMSKIPKLCPHFHLSVQSLDNEVLKNMNRKYDFLFLLERINKIKAKIKDCAFTCDIITAFPNESNTEFLNTLNRAKEIGFYEMHIFKYSKRKWTKAALMQNQIDGNIANSRSEMLIKQAKEMKNNYLNKYLNRVVSVLFENFKAGFLYGYTRNYIKVKVRGDKKLWAKECEVELVSIENDYILGKLLN